MPGRVSQLITSQQKKHLAVLIDPEKESCEQALASKCRLMEENSVDFVFIGGSSASDLNAQKVSQQIKNHCSKPLIGFPGHASQLNENWDGLLYLSLIGSKQAKYLFEEQLAGATQIRSYQKALDIYPCGYLLVDGGQASSTEKLTGSKGLSDQEEIINRCVNAEFLGQNHIYIEAGSGAARSVSPDLIRACRKEIQGTMIIGGGINSVNSATSKWKAGADVLVIGNFFEENPDKISEFCAAKDVINQAQYAS